MTAFKNAVVFRFFVFCLLAFDIVGIAGAKSNVDGDFSSIKKTGTLRVLVWSGGEGLLPRDELPAYIEQQYLEQFANLYRLNIDIIKIDHFENLIPSLLSGKGDLIASNFTVTRKRAKQVRFSNAIAHTVEYIVIALNAKELKNGEALNGRELSIQRGTSFWATAKGLEKVYPKLIIKEIDSSLSTDEIMDRVAKGYIDITIEDGNTLKALKTYRSDIKKSLQASGKRFIAWAVKPEHTDLLEKLNDFIEDNIVDAKGVKIKPKTVWDKIQQKKLVRIVLRNNMASYFIWRGELYGFNYELAKEFAKQQELKYQIIVAPDNANMLQYVVDGKADIALGFFTPNKDREDMGIAFSRPYHFASEMVVSQSKDNNIKTIDDINQRTFYVRPSSSYWYSLSLLQKQGLNIELKAISETMETEEVISHVGSGKYDLTLADSHLLDIELTWRDDIKGVFALGEPKEQSWAVNKNSKKLLAVVDNFIKNSYRGLFYNISYNKHFKNQSRLNQIRDYYSTLKESGTISPYDEMVKYHAKKYGFDWRLLVSQMFQESRFDTDAVSWSGAQGLFQVMPKTAKELGFDDMKDPESGIHAGVKYMNWVRDRMKYVNPREDQLIWFSLAAYNAGAGHVKDAVRLAEQQGLQPDIWFDNVEKAMLLLSKKKYASKARHGYVRGQEPVNYIINIMKRYEAYKSVTE